MKLIQTAVIILITATAAAVVSSWATRDLIDVAKPTVDINPNTQWKHVVRFDDEKEFILQCKKVNKVVDG